MCGRIAQAHTADELQELLGITVGADQLEGVRVSYNVPPTTMLPSLIAGDSGLEWSALMWGFRPAWMRKGRPMINARSETVREKPSFKRAISSRRCVVVATAYYEWLPTANGKQPYCIRSEGDAPLLMAGIFENGTCAIMTRTARDDLAFIHDRMPVLMPRSLVGPYVSEIGALETAFEAANVLPLYSYTVTRRVGNPRFNGPECIASHGT